MSKRATLPAEPLNRVIAGLAWLCISAPSFWLAYKTAYDSSLISVVWSGVTGFLFSVGLSLIIVGAFGLKPGRSSHESV